LGPKGETTGLTVAAEIVGVASEAAGRYAQAAFELALEANAVEALERDFTAFAAMVGESADLRAALQSPLIEPGENSRALVAVARKLGLSELGCNVIGLVAQNGRAGVLPGVFKAFAVLAARHRGARQVEITSATPLEPAQLDDLLKVLAKALGGKVEAVTHVDPSLLGGFIVQAGSRQFDSSLKTKLEALKLTLKGA
jgi:F-type H+-transporting ATPase subunit delta